MSYQMIHMEVAYRLLKPLCIKDAPSFLLASVAPDSVHMADHYDVQEKIHSHLFEGCGPWADTQDYERWLQNIAGFYEKWETAPVKDREFALGIVVHCYTDYCNDLYLFRRFQREQAGGQISVTETEWADAPELVHFPKPADEQEFRRVFSAEAFTIDQYVAKTSENRENIFRLLSEAESRDFANLIKGSQLEKTQYHLLHEQYEAPFQAQMENRMLTPSLIHEFLEKTPEFILKKLSDE